MSPNPYGSDYPTFQPRDQITPTGLHNLGHYAPSDNYFGFQPSSLARYSGDKTSSITGWAGALPMGSGSGSNSNSSSGGTTTPYLDANI